MKKKKQQKKKVNDKPEEFKGLMNIMDILNELNIIKDEMMVLANELKILRTTPLPSDYIIWITKAYYPNKEEEKYSENIFRWLMFSGNAYLRPICARCYDKTTINRYCIVSEKEACRMCGDETMRRLLTFYENRKISIKEDELLKWQVISSQQKSGALPLELSLSELAQV